MLFVPLRPPIVVARPRDWTRRLVWLAVTVLLAMLVVVALLVRLPDAWVAAVRGQEVALRVALVVVSLWIVRWLADLAYAQLPGASYMVGSAVVFPEQAGRRRVAVNQVEDVVVEVRPAPVHEAFVLLMRDGTTHLLCATHQIGAPALYTAVARRVARRKRRAARRGARLLRPEAKR